MTRQEEDKIDDRDRERNIRYIRAKLPGATARDIGILASIVRALSIIGWSESEYCRDI